MHKHVRQFLAHLGELVDREAVGVSTPGGPWTDE
jgi:hypothetical protein